MRKQKTPAAWVAQVSVILMLVPSPDKLKRVASDKASGVKKKYAKLKMRMITTDLLWLRSSQKENTCINTFLNLYASIVTNYMVGFVRLV